MHKTLYKFRNHKVSPETKILIIGTFNPDLSRNTVDFFYGRQRNYLWRLLPEVYSEGSLKEASTEMKKKFMRRHKIDFTDLIASVEHNEEMKNYSDKFLEKQRLNWNKTEELIRDLKNLKYVFFTRRTFGGIPKLKARFFEIQKECNKRQIRSSFLVSPARVYNASKLAEWQDAFG